MCYIAVIGDIKESKKIENRYFIQEELNHVLNQINRVYDADISARFVITLGDEFQGLLSTSEHLLDVIKYIQRKMYPVRLRFGVGIGGIRTKIFHKAAIGADGPAFYAARSMIEELRVQEKKLKKQAADIQVSVYEEEYFEITQINMMLLFMKVIENGWSDKQRYTIWDMEQNGGSQEECAKRMRTTQSTVARRLADGNFIIYGRTKETIEEALGRLERTYNDC